MNKREEIKQSLEEKLIVGAKIKIGRKCAKAGCGLEEGQIIELVQGYFDYENGLYCETEVCPAIQYDNNEFDSIYHLFGNDLEYFLDSEIIISKTT